MAGARGILLEEDECRKQQNLSAIRVSLLLENIYSLFFYVFPCPVTS